MSYTKKGKAQWRQYGFPDFPQDFALTDKQAKDLWDIISLKDHKVQGTFRTRLDALANEHRHRHADKNTTPLLRDQNDALKKVLAAARKARQKLLDLDRISTEGIRSALDKQRYVDEEAPESHRGYKQYVNLRCRLEHFTGAVSSQPEEFTSRRGIERLLKSLGTLERMLRELDHISLDAVLSVLEERPPSFPNGASAELEEGSKQLIRLSDRLEHFIETLEPQLEKQKAHRGRIAEIIQETFIRKVAVVYEEQTGEAPANTAHIDGDYKGVSQSEGGRFIETFVRKVDAGIGVQRVSTVLRDYARERKLRARNALQKPVG